MAICTGEGLFVGSNGAVEVDLCGHPERGAWPYSCSITTYNGLHQASTGCLWASPLTLRNLFNGSGYGTTGTATTSTTISGTSVVVNVVNTDPCRAAEAFIVVDCYWGGTPSAAADVNFFRQITGTTAPDGAHNQTWRWAYTLTERVQRISSELHTMTLAAGANGNVTVAMSVSTNSGTFVVDLQYAHVRGFVTPITV